MIKENIISYKNIMGLLVQNELCISKLELHYK